MKHNIFRALHEKPFFYLWLGEVFTQISFNLLNFFLILLVFSLTKSNTAVSIVVISFTLPAILCGVLAGVYVDKWNKRKVLYISNIIRAILLVILAFSYHSVIAIYTLSFFIALATQFFIPAESPMIPLIVKKKLLLSANALFGIALFGSILVAYLLSGPIIIFLGYQNTLLFMSFLLLLGAFFIYLIKFYEQPKIVGEKALSASASLFSEIKNALSYIRHSRPVSRSLFFLAVSQILILIFAVITPGYAQEVLHINIEDFPLRFIAPAAIGVVVGAILIVHFMHDFSKEKLVTIGIFLSGISMIAMPYGASIASREFVHYINTFIPSFIEITMFHIVLFVAFILGFANAFVFVPSNTILQEKTTDQLRGKMYGMLSSVVGVFSLLPVILVGSFADIFGVSRVIAGIGVSVVLLGFVRVFIDR